MATEGRDERKIGKEQENLCQKSEEKEYAREKGTRKGE